MKKNFADELDKLAADYVSKNNPETGKKADVATMEAGVNKKEDVANQLGF